MAVRGYVLIEAEVGRSKSVADGVASTTRPAWDATFMNATYRARPMDTPLAYHSPSVVVSGPAGSAAGAARSFFRSAAVHRTTSMPP